MKELYYLLRAFGLIHRKPCFHCGKWIWKWQKRKFWLGSNYQWVHYTCCEQLKKGGMDFPNLLLLKRGEMNHVW